MREEGIHKTLTRIMTFMDRYGGPAHRTKGKTALEVSLRNWQEMVTTLISAEFEARQVPVNRDLPVPVDVIAFYLPQYHPFPENDEWWGAGFTEWRNVVRAMPQFSGHYQPRIPADLGFYDLRTPGIMAEQARMARAAGLAGFCFYFYWFGGKVLMEMPLKQWLDDPSIDFPFCICWANENWTRRWDGLEQDILIAQEYSAEDDIRFISYISRYLAHPRYIRQDGRPLLLVYQAGQLPDARATAQRWRTWWNERTNEDLFLVCVHSKDHPPPEPMGFDACVEFPPVGSTAKEFRIGTGHTANTFKGGIYDYQHLATSCKSLVAPDYLKFRGVMPSWDNTARRKNSGFIFHGGAPSTYRDWLHEALTYSKWFGRPGKRSLVFINAWNEWAEGAYLEPDLRFGYAYLNATASAVGAWSGTDVRCMQNGRRAGGTAVILHIYYPELADEFSQALAHLDADVWISITAEAHFGLVRKFFPQAHIFLCPNRGRDIAPFIALLSIMEKDRYRWILKLHSKRSPHRQDGNAWRRTLVTSLLPTGVNMGDLLDAIEGYSNIGLIAPGMHCYQVSEHIGSNAPLLGRLERLLGSPILPEDVFIAGSMFWFRPEAIAPLLGHRLLTGDFEFESGQVDGTLAHAVERYIGACVRSAGYGIVEFPEAQLLMNTTHSAER